MFPIPGLDLSPLRIATWLVIVVWMLATLFLLDNYLSSNALIERGTLFPFLGGASASDHLTLKETRQLGLGIRPAWDAPTRQNATARLLRMVRLQKQGGDDALAQIYVKAKNDAKDSESEEYKMAWAPVLSCALAGCPGKDVIEAAGQLASSDVRYAPNAMIVEAVYYYEAKKAQNGEDAAAHDAHLKQLVADFGSPALYDRLGKLEECGAQCADLDARTLDFISEAAGS